MSTKDSEFKALQIIEDTIEGVIGFVDQLAYTLFYLGILPHRFPKKWIANRERFVKPFTLTALSVFVLYLGLVRFFRFELVQQFAPSFTEVPGDVSHYASLARLFFFSIPAIVVLYLLARMIARLGPSGASTQADIANLALYACSFCCIPIAVVVFIRPGPGLLNSFALFYGFVVSSVLTWALLTDEYKARRTKTLLCSLLYPVASLTCIVTVVVVGIAIELYPAFHRHLEKERQANFEREVKRLVGQVRQSLDLYPSDENYNAPQSSIEQPSSNATRVSAADVDQ